jgi:hypothetical protein
LGPGKTLPRDANLNSQVRIQFVTDAENDYFRRDDEPGEMKLFQVIDGELRPARNWRTPTVFEGSVTLALSLPAEAEVGNILTYQAHVTDASRLEPFVNEFVLTVKAEREVQVPRPSQSPGPKPDKPGEQSGKDAQTDSRLAAPNPTDVWEKDWDTHDPRFDKFTAMHIKRPPGSDENSAIFDYFINMNNIFIDQAIKEKPRRVHEIRDRYKFGMTLITLAVIRHDLEARKRAGPVKAEDDERPERQDVRDMVAEVTSAIAPFLLPLVDSLSRITGGPEPLSAIAGEAA